MGKCADRSRRRVAVLLAAGLLTAAGTVYPACAEESETTAQLLAEGTYEVPEGWSEDTASPSETETSYKQSESMTLEETSVITCSYIGTNYSVLEYEQLRDMLTNDMIYSNVNAKISSTCIYTDSMDYLFILTADDASQEYRQICYYVVGDLECFKVDVKEYREEAESAKAAQEMTPEEAGKEIAATFTW